MLLQIGPSLRLGSKCYYGWDFYYAWVQMLLRMGLLLRLGPNVIIDGTFITPGSNYYTCAFNIVPVWVSSSNDDQCVLTYALIDCQSNASFITDQLRETLKVDGIESHLRLSTMHKEDELIQCKKVQETFRR